MRILYLHQYFSTPEMSTGTRSYEMARRLVADGHDVHMITSDRNGGPKREETIDGIRVTWIPVEYSGRMSKLRRVRAFLSFAARSSLLAARSRADVVFATSTPPTIAIPGIIAKWFQRIPMVFEVRDPWPEMLIGMGVISNPLLIRLSNLFKKFAYSQSARIIALSEGMKDTIVASGYDEQRITVIPNLSSNDVFGQDDEGGKEFRNRYPWLGDRKLVLYAGALGIANAVGYLVEVATRVKEIDPEIRFLVVGAGAEEEKIRQQAAAAGVLDSTFFMLPFVQKKEVPAVFSAATVSCVLLMDVPELWTNSSNKFFDSLAAGRPVAVNNVGWQHSLLEEHNAGILLHPTDTSGAAETLISALHDNEWLTEAGSNARSIAETEFDSDLLYGKFQLVLREVVNQPEEA